MISNFYCPGNPTFLNTFDLSYAPPLLYYAYVLIVVIAILFGIYVFVKDKYSLQSLLIFALSVVFSLWIFNMALQWLTVPANFNHFEWQITAFFEIFIPIFPLYFVYVFLNKKDAPFAWKVFFGIIILSVFALLPTKWNMQSFDVENCQSNLGPLLKIIYVFELLCAFLIIYVCAKKFKGTQKGDSLRKQIVLLVAGTSLFLIIFFLSNIFGELTQIYSINLFGPIGMVAFLGLMTYMIVRFKAFNIKLVGAQALVLALFALVGSEFFFATGAVSLTLIGITLITIMIFGQILVRSVKKEVEQKEKIEKMAKEIEKAYEVEKQANKELEKLDKYKNNFLMQVQHDMRNPLSTLMGYADLLLEGSYGKLAKNAKDIITKMQDIIQNKIKDVNNFLDTEQFKMGKGVVALKPGVDISSILEEIISALNPKIQEKGIYLRFERPEEALVITADREKLKAAIFNIADNAVKYTEKGGVAITLKKEKEKVRIEIKDSGIGIPQEKIENIFEGQFERTQLAQKAASGSGVGLYLSGQIIKLHNGKVWAESAGEGKGSIFYIELPILKN